MICTRSKSIYPVIRTANGKYCYDIHNQGYLDFTGSNLTVLLGYESPHLSWDVPPNVPGQSEIQLKVESKLRDITNKKDFIFFKNGHNAVDCAVRLARYVLKDNNADVMFYGYHGTGSEYVSTINMNGITDGQANSAVQIKSLKEYVQGTTWDILVYESRYKQDAEKINAKIKICDHLKSGYFGLFEKQADFDLYGKSLANGYPVSVLAGDLSRINEIYYSTTYGGDNIGLTAIAHVLNEMPKHYDTLRKLSDYMYKHIPCVATGIYNGILYSYRNDRITSDRVKMALEKRLIIGQWLTLFPSHTTEDIDRLKEFCV